MDGKKVAFTTLGCKVNQVESEALANIFRTAGYQVVDFKEYADVYLVNTCTVTHLGNRKSRQMIRRAVKTNPKGIVVVTGCYAQTAPGEVLAIPGVDLVVGTRDRNNLLELLTQVEKSNEPINAVNNIMEAEEFEELPMLQTEGRTRAFIKIQEGCNNYCSYCIIPYARGPLRSRKQDKVLEEAKTLVEQGFQEIVLTGICTGTYGRDHQAYYRLNNLLRDLSSVEGLARLRLSSVEPTDFTSEMIETISNSKIICRHLHIPLQSGSDATLKRMNRHYTTEEYAKLLKRLKDQTPGLAITTDVIVGFPGETEEEYQETYDFIEQQDFSALHVFKFSPRKGTPAAEFPDQVPPEVKEERSRKLIELSKQKGQNFANRFLNTEAQVLVEQLSSVVEGHFEGLTDNYLRVLFPADAGIEGKLLTVKLEKLKDNYLLGKLLNN